MPLAVRQFRAVPYFELDTPKRVEPILPKDIQIKRRKPFDVVEPILPKEIQMKRRIPFDVVEPILPKEAQMKRRIPFDVVEPILPKEVQMKRRIPLDVVPPQVIEEEADTCDDSRALIVRESIPPHMTKAYGVFKYKARDYEYTCYDPNDDYLEYSASDGAPLLRKDSAECDPIQSTQNAAAAFGDDIADDAYSVSELSHYNEDKRGRRHSKSKGQGHSFNKSKLSKLERQESSSHQPNGDKVESSSEHSDEGASASLDSSGDSDITTTTFASFAQTRFQVKVPHTYSCSSLTQPLLSKEDKADYLASLAAWVSILRIMGDMPDTDTGDSIITVSGSQVLTTSRIKSCFKAKYTKKDIDDVHRKYTELFKDPVSMDSRTIPFLSSTPTTMLDKVQAVCSMGIYKPALRDELYSQLCKQLSNNPSKNSSVRGWVLLSLFAGSFSPSERLAPSLANFVQDGPGEFSEKVDRLMRRTSCVGTRCYPPSWLEFQAAKNGKPILVPVTFMNGFRMLCEVDPATTIQELLMVICERLNISDPVGYAIYVSLHTKISCLGNSKHRILDAISECEQHSKTMGLRESTSPWRLFFRREMFPPWYTPGLDPVSNDLCYQQLRRGIAMGEYRLDKVDDLVDLLAKTYYIDHKDDTALSELAPFIKANVPQNILERKPENYYLESATARYEQLELGTKKPSEESLKTELVTFAKDKYTVLFCRYYDAQRASGPNLNLQDIVIGLNEKGLYIVDSSDTLKLHLHFSELVEVTKTSRHHLVLKVNTLEEYTIHTHHGEDMLAQLTLFLDELKQRSLLALALQDITSLDGPSEENIEKGDVLNLTQCARDWGRGLNVPAVCRRTGKPHEVPKSDLYIVPTTQEPEPRVLATLGAQIRKDASSLKPDGRRPQHSLQQFAKNNFRSTSEGSVTKFLNKASFKKDRSDCLWAHTKEALKKPLLKKTCQREDICKLACHTFTSIQTYMTNLVINDNTANYNLCRDWVLDPARRNKYIREEVFCQVVKQITNNPDRSSEDRGWVLLTLLTSLTCPSNDLCDTLVTFVQRSNHPLASMCEKHLKGSRRGGSCRLYSSHLLEHDMVSKQQPNVRVQVCLPSQTVQTVEVMSTSKILHIKQEIASRLKLKSFNEYSLFFTANEKVFCLPDRAYYFDCLSHSELFWFKGGKRNGSPSHTPLLVMLKKIWVNGQPGVDPVADQTFHFPQESPNYLRGYYNLPDDTIYQMAALSYKANFDDGGKKMEKFSDISPVLLPKGFLDGKDVDKVKEAVQKELETKSKLSPLEAKTNFLKHLCHLNTYGSVFFEVKQRHMDSLPKNCLIAINYTGVHVLNRNKKETIKSFDYHSVPNWAFDENSFTFIVTSGQSTSKLLMETPVGHNMDDLLMSYVAWIMNYQMRKKHGFISETSGESIC